MLLYGKNKLQIQECQKLLSISDTEIIIQCSIDKFIITGNGLRIIEYGQQQMFIIGIIEAIGILHA